MPAPRLELGPRGIEARNPVGTLTSQFVVAVASVFDRFTDRVGSYGIALAQRRVNANGGIATGLTFGLRIEFGADDHCCDAYPHPGEESDQAAEGAVGCVIIAEVGRVPREQQRDDQNDRCGECRPRGNPAPLSLLPAWTKAV